MVSAPSLGGVKLPLTTEGMYLVSNRCPILIPACTCAALLPSLKFIKYYSKQKLSLYINLCVYTYTHMGEGVCSGCDGFQRQLRAVTAAPGEEEDDAGREGGQCCSCPKALVGLGREELQGGMQVDNAALP